MHFERCTLVKSRKLKPKSERVEIKGKCSVSKSFIYPRTLFGATLDLWFIHQGLRALTEWRKNLSMSRRRLQQIKLLIVNLPNVCLCAHRRHCRLVEGNRLVRESCTGGLCDRGEPKYWGTHTPEPGSVIFFDVDLAHIATNTLMSDGQRQNQRHLPKVHQKNPKRLQRYA